MADRLRTLHVLLTALLATTAAARDGRAAPACEERASEGTLQAVADGGEFRLADGAVLRLADLRLPPDGEAGRRVSAWLRSLAGGRLRVREVGPPDRWGRAPAHLELVGATPIDIGELLVADGLAAVDAGQRDILCRPELLASEGKVRAARRGIWAEGPWPIPASAREALAGAAGSFAIVQGKVVSVGERRERTYLNFGRDWSRDFSVTIPRRSWAILVGRGMNAAALTGREVRVRGLVEMRRGPTLDLTVPDMLELIEVAGREPPAQRTP